MLVNYPLPVAKKVDYTAEADIFFLIALTFIVSLVVGVFYIASFHIEPKTQPGVIPENQTVFPVSRAEVAQIEI